MTWWSRLLACDPEPMYGRCMQEQRPETGGHLQHLVDRSDTRCVSNSSVHASRLQRDSTAYAIRPCRADGNLEPVFRDQ